MTKLTAAQRHIKALQRVTLEDHLATRLRQVGLGHFKWQYRAIPGCKFTWDFAFVDERLLIEVQGGTWQAQRTGHSTGVGIARDCAKLNLATLHGWRTLQFTSDMVLNDDAVSVIQAVLDIEEKE